MIPKGKKKAGDLPLPQTKHKKKKQRGKKKNNKTIGTTSLKQQGGCNSATDRLMMGKSEASSVHI